MGDLPVGTRTFVPAIAIWKETAEEVPYNARALENYAAVEDTDVAAAIRAHDRAIELKPDYAEAYNNRGNLYARAGRYEGSRSETSTRP